MFKNIREHKNLIELVLMITISIAIQVLTIAKSSIAAGYFGTSSEMDAFSFSNNFSSLIFGFVVAGIPTIVIPLYIKKDCNKTINSFVSILFSFLVLFSLVLIVFRTPIVSLLGGRDNEFTKISSDILFLLTIANLLSAFSNVTLAYFHCIEKFSLPKIVSFVSQLATIILLLVFRDLNIYGYAFIVAGSLAFNFLFDLLFAILFGWRFGISFSFDEEVKKTFKRFFPIIFSTGIYRLSLLIDTTIATRLGKGDVTVLSYSNQISNMVNALFVGNLLVFFYPKLVGSINEKKESHDLFWKQASFIFLIIVLLVSGFSCIGKEGISLLFEHGNFDSESSNKVFLLTLIYFAGQLFSCVVDYVYRFFYANGNTKDPSINSCIIGISNIIVSIVLSLFIGVYGIVIGTSISAVISLILILIRFRKKYSFGKTTKEILALFVPSIISGLLSTAIVLITKHFVKVDGWLLNVLIFGAEDVICYVLLSLAINRKNLMFLKTIK